MLISKQEYFKRISNLNDENLIRNYLISDVIDISVIAKLHLTEPIPAVSFYSMLLSKLHKITVELMRLEPLQVSECIKTATSIITQATITLEKQFKNDQESANEFMDCIGLKSLSKALYVFFTNGNSALLESELNRVRDDMLFVKNNIPKLAATNKSVA